MRRWSIVIFAILFMISIMGFTSWENNISRGQMKLTIQNDLSAYGIEVVGPENTNFDNELRVYVGPNSYVGAAALVNAAKPLAIFIKNDSENDVVGLALRWKFVTSNGELKEMNQVQSSPGILMGMVPRDPSLIGKTSLINAKTLRFLTYYESVGTQIGNLFKSNRSERIAYQLDSKRVENSLAEMARQNQGAINGASEMVVVLDAVIFSNGTCVGRDESFLFESINGLVQAKRDFLNDLRAAKQNGKSDKGALDELSLKHSASSSPERSRRPATGKEAFEKAYQSSLADLTNEIDKKRLHATDEEIASDFLAVRDSDFIKLKKEVR